MPSENILNIDCEKRLTGRKTRVCYQKNHSKNFKNRKNLKRRQKKINSDKSTETQE